MLSHPFRRRATRLLRMLGAVAAALLVVAIAEGTGVTSLLQARLSEVRFALHPRAPSGDVVLVDIDSQSLAEVGVWPWPRTLHADLVRAATEAGAARIAFDVDFSSASDPQADAAFAEAIDESGIDTLLAAFRQSDAQGKEQASLPIASLLRSAWPAAVNVAPDADGAVRSLPVAMTIGGAPVPSMAALIAARDPVAEGSFGIDFSIEAASIPRLSYVDVLAHRVDPELLAGRTLLVGASAVELHDLFPVPVFGTVPGSTVLALGAETLLQDRALRPVEMPWVVLAACAVLLSLVLRRCRLSRGMILLAAVACGLEAAAFALQDVARLCVATAPLHALLFGLGGARLVHELGVRRVLAWIAKVRADNSQSMLERVVDEGFGGVVLIDERMRIMRVNEEARRLLGVSLGGSVADLPEPLAQACRRSVLPCEDAGPAQRLSGILRQQEGARTIEYTVAPLRLATIEGGGFERAGEATHICLTVHDVTERQTVEDRMRYLALHDALTGLANRRALAARLADDAGRGEGDPERCSALIAFGLDRFKAVNDVLGHGIGDQVLIEVARRAERCMPEYSVVARLGGDEFMIVLRDRPPGDVHDLAGRLLEAIRQPIVVSSHRLCLGASLGLCLWSGGTAAPDDLMRRADLALHGAKRTGGIRVFEPGMELDRLSRLELERELLDAVETDALTLAFQPQVALRTGAITGAEALVRWRHPVKGFVSPAVFIPVAEEMGLIHRIGARVLLAACREAAAWARPVRVAVNVSALQLSTGDVVAAVREALDRSGLPAERLELEITESAFVNEDARLKAIFDDLLALGVSFSLDDFGTGYSSLGYLHRFPISKLKIDRSFVTNLPGDGASLAILRSILALTQGLGLRSIAEGIETQEQAEALRLLGCAEGQGYLYSKPLDASAMGALLATDDACDAPASDAA